MAYKKSRVGLGLGTISGLSTYNTSFLTSKIAGAGSDYNQIESAEVIDIDLNPEKPENVGRIRYRLVSNTGAAQETLNWAYPLIPYYRMYPVIGEIVVIIEIEHKHYWLSVLNVFNMLNNNLLPDLTERNINEGENKSNNYKEVQASGIPLSQEERIKSAGQTFKSRRTKIGILSPNEGDTIIEGRFSNSIRLGNNPETNSPNIKISVREPLDDFSIDKEDLNQDSCIFITSDEILNFNPVGVPISDVNNPPNEYSGKQIYITSDRLIFSSKLNEMLFFSNKTISFGSNDNFSVDTDKKIVFNSKSNFELSTEQILKTNSKEDTNINTQKKFILNAKEEAKLHALKVMIGNMDADEPLVLGKKWKEAMLTIIDVLMNHTHPTGTGPSGTILPPELNKLNNLKQQINNNIHLSDDNFTSKKN